MSIPTIDKILRPEDGVEVIAAILEASDLPIRSVIKYDESFATAYPAVQVMSGGFEKNLHALHTWLLTIRVDIYVMHTLLTEDRQTRNLNDLRLASDVVALLEGSIDGGAPLELGNDRVIAGWVEKEQPGRMPPSGITKGKAVVGTLLSYMCTNEGRY